MSTPEAGRLLSLISEEAGWDIPALFREYEAVPKKIYGYRQRIAPLKAEMALLQARYEAKGQQPSQYDDERKTLLAELKEDERDRWERENESDKPLSDGRAEDKARASKRYRDFVREAGEERRRIADLGRQVGELYDRIEVWKGRKEYLEKLLDQCKAVTYTYGSEARLVPR